MTRKKRITHHEPDDLDAMIAEATAEDPRFPARFEAARRRRQLVERLADFRREQGQTQRDVAATMRTSQSAVARLERETYDTLSSTLDDFALALGYRIEYSLVKIDEA